MELTPLEIRQRCAELCELSYLGTPQFSRLGMEVFFVEETEYFYIVFRGSDSKGDWLDNFRFIGKSFRGNKYHGGYLKKVIANMQRLLQYVNTNKPIIITGHSKGGAEAVIFGSISGIAPDQIITFGAPRAVKKADTSLQKFLAARLTSYKNKYDQVTQLPPLWPDYGKVVTSYFKRKGFEHYISLYKRFF